MSELPDRTEVLVVGAGPVGLAVAASLAGHGHDVTVVERQAAGAKTSRAAVVHARTLEMLERIGVSERLAGLGIHARQFSIRDGDRELVPVPFDRLRTEYPYTLMVPQNITEQVLLERLEERLVPGSSSKGDLRDHRRPACVPSLGRKPMNLAAPS